MLLAYLILIIQPTIYKIECETFEQFGCKEYPMKAEFIIYDDSVIVNKVLNKSVHQSTLIRQSKNIYKDKETEEFIMFRHDDMYCYLLGTGFNIRLRIKRTWKG